MTTPMPETITVYASIGNSDDKLPQFAWSAFVGDFADAIERPAERIHGMWFSASDSPYQNACVCFEIGAALAEDLKAQLAEIRTRYGQDSIAWAVVSETEFV